MSHTEPHGEAGKFSSYEKRKGLLPISWEDYFSLVTLFARHSSHSQLARSFS